MKTKEGMVKDGKTIDKEKPRVSETINGFSKIEMDNPIEMGITEKKGIDKLGIWSVFATKKDIKGMIVHYGGNIKTMRIRILSLRFCQCYYYGTMYTHYPNIYSQ